MSKYQMPLFIYLLEYKVYLKIKINNKEFCKELFFIIALVLNAGNSFNSK